MFTVDYIAKDMGLSIPFIRKCLKQLDKLLKPHYSRGDSNQIIFTESGYVIFDQIKRLKAQGLNINIIKEHLEQHIHQATKSEEAAIQSVVKHMPNDFDMFNKLFAEKEARLKERAEHQQRILELENLSDHLKSQLLYITDGKSPEEYKNVWYQEQMEKQQLKTISEQLKEQLSNITDGKPPEEFKKQWQQEQLDKQRIAWLIKEIQSLEGIFSVVNYFKRKKLYRELQGLMTKQNTEPSNDASNAT
jgi:hypothetical protein